MKLNRVVRVICQGIEGELLLPVTWVKIGIASPSIYADIRDLEKIFNDKGILGAEDFLGHFPGSKLKICGDQWVNGNRVSWLEVWDRESYKKLFSLLT